MFHRILVPLDGSFLAESVLSHVIAISQPYDAEVTFAHVVDHGVAVGERQVDPVAWHLLKAESQNYLQEIANRWAEVAPPSETVLLEGSAAERIISYAEEQDCDLIVLSSHGRSGLSEWNVSSVVQKILMRAYRSVMVVRAAAAERQDRLQPAHYERILVPLDGSRRAEGILPLVQRLLEAYEHQLEIILVHVVQKPIPFRNPPSVEDITLVDEIVQRNTQEATEYLDQLCEQLGPCAQRYVVASESPSLALLDWADSQKADLVLFSAHGRTAGQFPYGSLVTGFINYGQTPLLIFQDLPKDQLHLSLSWHGAERPQRGRQFPDALN